MTTFSLFALFRGKRNNECECRIFAFGTLKHECSADRFGGDPRYVEPETVAIRVRCFCITTAEKLETNLLFLHIRDSYARVCDGEPKGAF